MVNAIQTFTLHENSAFQIFKSMVFFIWFNLEFGNITLPSCPGIFVPGLPLPLHFSPAASQRHQASAAERDSCRAEAVGGREAVGQLMELGASGAREPLVILELGRLNH